MKKLVLFIALIMLGFGSYAQNIESNLVAHFTFCGDLNDLSGNNNHGEFMGGNQASFGDDRFGNTNSALSLVGISEYVSVPSSESLDSPVEHITVACWFNYASHYGGWITPFTKTNEMEVSSRQYGFGINAYSGQVYMSTTYVGQYLFEVLVSCGYNLFRNGTQMLFKWRIDCNRNTGNSCCSKPSSFRNR